MLTSKVCIVDRTEILRYAYAWDLWDILQWEEESSDMAICRWWCRYIYTIEHDIPWHLIPRMTHDWESEWWLARAVVTEDRDRLASGECVVEVVNDLLVVYWYWYMAECEHRGSIGKNNEKSTVKTPPISALVCIDSGSMIHILSPLPTSSGSREVYPLTFFLWKKSSSSFHTGRIAQSV